MVFSCLDQDDGAARSLNLSGQSGQVVQIVRPSADCLNLPLGQQRGGDFALSRKAQSLKEQALRLKSDPGFGFKKNLVDRLAIQALLHAIGGGAMGLRGGVGVPETAGVCGHGGINALAKGQIRRHFQQQSQLPDQLSYSGATGVQQNTVGITGVGGMMVHAQINFSPPALGALGQQIFVGDIHSKHGFRLKLRRGKQSVIQKAIFFRQLLVGLHPGGFAQPAQQAAQSGGGAHGIPVGPAMGQDQKAVPLTEKFRRLIQGQRRRCFRHRHSAPPEKAPAAG